MQTETTLENLEEKLAEIFENNCFKICETILNDEIVVNESIKVQIPEFGLECFCGYLLDEEKEIQAPLTIIYQAGKSIENFDYYESDDTWVTLHNYLQAQNKKIKSETKCIICAQLLDT